MKSNSFFVYTTAIISIAHLISWIRLTSTNLSHWWRKFWNWHRQQQRRYNYHHQYHTSSNRTMYEFRPFELTLCDYKSYAKATSIGRGINVIPKPRSGHRVAANESDLFSFGGKMTMRFHFILMHFDTIP